MKIKKFNWKKIDSSLDYSIISCSPKNTAILTEFLDQEYVSLSQICNTFFPRKLIFKCDPSIPSITSSDVLEYFQSLFNFLQFKYKKLLLEPDVIDKLFLEHNLIDRSFSEVDKLFLGIDKLFSEHDLIKDKAVSRRTIVNCHKAISLMIMAKLLPKEIEYMVEVHLRRFIRRASWDLKG